MVSVSYTVVMSGVRTKGSTLPAESIAVERNCTTSSGVVNKAAESIGTFVAIGSKTSPSIMAYTLYCHTPDRLSVALMVTVAVLPE